MCSIKDVAKLAGVSTATVSRVLNDDKTYKMTDETRLKVREAASALAYTLGKADPAVKPRIGCVLSVTKDKYSDPYFMSILSGIEEQLAAEGLSLTFLRTFFELEDDVVLTNTFAGGITGVILMETLKNRTYEYIRQKTAHIVGIDTQREDIDNVGYDYFHAATQITEHLIARGHRRIGYIGGSGESGEIRRSKRYQGFAATLHVHGLEVNPAWVMDCRWDEPLCIDQVKTLAAMKDRPTAIFAASDLMAMAALSGLYGVKVRVPEEMAVIGLSDIELSKYSNPPLSTYHIQTREIGARAVKMLLSRIRGDNSLPCHVLIPGNLVIRDST